MVSNETAEGLLTIDIERVDNTAVVRCHGKLVAGVDGAFYSRISLLIPDSQKIVLDLTDLKHMDSMGLGALVRLYVSTKSGSCALELINLGPRVRQLLGLTDLLSVFTVIGEHGVKIL
jgi:anti-sigma B factor antagonist